MRLPAPAALRRAFARLAAATAAAALLAAPAIAQTDAPVPDAIEVSPAISDIAPVDPAPSGPETPGVAPAQPGPATGAVEAPAADPAPAAGAAPSGTAADSQAPAAADAPADGAVEGPGVSTVEPPAGADPATPPDPAALPAGELALVTASGVHRFTVEIADDPVERSRGLMFRTEMAADHGMLFDFATEGPRSFWMKNTPLSLDIIFARADGTIVSIAKGTVPYSTDSIPSEGDARFVLEVNAGVADRIGLAPGDRLLHRRIAR